MNEKATLDERIATLRNEGHTAVSITDVLKEEGYTTKKGSFPNEGYVTNKISALRKAGVINKTSHTYNRHILNPAKTKSTWNYSTVNNLLDDDSITAEKKVACMKVLFG